MACAWAVPAVEFRDRAGIGLPAILLFESATIPVLWPLLSFLLIKRGPRKDTIITALVLAAVTVALAIFIGMFGVAVLSTFMRPGAARAMQFDWDVLART